MGLLVLGAGASRARRLLVFGVFLTVGVLALGAVEAHAATPSSLAGETFSGTSGSASGTCTSANNGSFTFSASGTAAGPYPGTFTESGSFTMARGRLRAFSASFTITSANGSVTGSKSLTPAGASGSCDAIGQAPLVFIDSPSSDTYTATINGSYRDTGTAVNTGMIWALNQGQLLRFGENFTTSNGVTPIGTRSTEQCKNGGWKQFGRTFKNQGDCMSFVATRGKNPPSGSQLPTTSTAARGSAAGGASSRSNR
jgi:hypothetical protein